MAQPHSARPFAIEQAHRQLRRLSTCTNRAAKSCGAEAVHHVRVAIRRFTQALAVCKPYFRADDMPNRRRLKKIMAGAGEVRNYDVALKYAARFKVPHAVQLRAKLQGKRKELAVLLTAELKKWTGRRMAPKWHRVLNNAPAAGKEDQATLELARETLGRIASDFLKRGNEAASADASPKTMHRFRLVAKKFRYALELFQPLDASAIDPLVASIKGASALLGDINDCVTVAAIVSDYKGGHRLADRLKKRQHKKTEDFRKYWKNEFADGERPRSSIEGMGRAESPVPKKPAASSRTSSGLRKSA